MELDLTEPRETFYVQWGEWPVWGSMLLVALGIWMSRKVA